MWSKLLHKEESDSLMHSSSCSASAGGAGNGQLIEDMRDSDESNVTSVTVGSDCNDPETNSLLDVMEVQQRFLFSCPWPVALVCIALIPK